MVTYMNKPYFRKTILILFMTIFLLLTFSHGVVFAAGQSENDANIANKVEPQIRRLMNTMGIPGVAVGIVEGNRVVYSQGFGVCSNKRKLPITPNTVFDMASVSKVFTATALMQLHEQGKLDLDAPVTHYVPYFKMDDARYASITLRQLLTHLSGLSNGWIMNWVSPQNDSEALERFVRSLGKEKLESDPGTRYNYSNIGFDILADVIAKTSGEAFEDYMHNHVLAPLDMSSSSFYLPVNTANVAVGHVQRGTLLDTLDRGTGLIARRIWIEGAVVEEAPVYPYNREHAGCGTLSSTVVDMCNWMLAFLHEGEFGGNQLLKPETINEMWKSYTETGVMAPKNLEYLVSREREQGLGWKLGEYHGFRTAGHGGSDVGYSTDISIIPERSIGVVVLCNADFAYASQITSFLLDTMLGYDSKIENLGKPIKQEPVNPILIIMPVLCVLLLCAFALKRYLWLAIATVAVLVFANLYTIFATTIPIWVLISVDVVYLAIFAAFLTCKLQGNHRKAA